MEVIEKILYKDERATLIKNIIAIVVVTGWAKNFAWLLYYRGPSGLVKEWKTTFLARFFRFVKSFAIVQKLIKKETGKIMDDMKHEVLSKNGGESFTSLPAQGTKPEQLQKLLDSLASLTNPDHLNGKASGSVYHGISELTKMTNEAYRLFSCSNPLHPDIFPGVRKMEAEIVSMVIKMFNGGSNACGTTTSGGTESILMACKAMRDWGLDVKGITEPEIVIPVSAHAAFDKAAHYFKIKLLYAPVDEKTRKVDIKAVKRMVTPNTVMIVGSAPSFPHGVIDDIQELAKIARRNKIGLHVDSCLGGFLVPFMEKAGFPLAPFDFRVEGVTSISCDTHKYGFAPKGSSVVMYSSPEYRKYQYFVAPDWPGGIYASPTIAGSRPGALIAGCWAALMYMGEEGYVQSTKSIVTTARKIASAIQGTPGLKLYGEPEVSVVAFGSDEFNVYRLGHELGKRGWNLNSLQYPASLHICCTQLTASVADKFISDVAEITSEIMKGPKDKSAEGMGAIYGMASAIPDRSMVDMLARGFIDSLYSV